MTRSRHPIMDVHKAPTNDLEPQPAKTQAAGDAEAGSATLLQIAGAVFWSFFGVRKGVLMRRDAVTIKPLHVIVVGVLAAAAFVVSLLVIVRFIIRMAG